MTATNAGRILTDAGGGCAAQKGGRMAEWCEHIEQVHQLMKALDVVVGGCGCCGSPWVSCNQCNVDGDGNSLGRGEDGQSESAGG